MTQTTPPAPEGHQRIWEMIPWIINDRASESQRREVEVHLQTCEDCRDEFAFQRRVQATLTAPVADRSKSDPGPALARLWARVDGVGGIAQAGGTRDQMRRAPRRRLMLGLCAALLLETIGLGLFASELWGRSRTAGADYRTLSAAPPVALAATIRMVVTPALRVEDLQRLLQRSKLQIVGGPSEAGVYSLAPNDGAAGPTPASVLQQLRADPGVRFAEPVDASPPH